MSFGDIKNLSFQMLDAKINLVSSKLSFYFLDHIELWKQFQLQGTRGAIVTH